MKRALIIGPRFHYFNQCVERAYQALGYQTQVLAFDNPVHPYTFENKIRYKFAKDKLAMKRRSRALFHLEAEAAFLQFEPDVVFVMNGDMLLPDTLLHWRGCLTDDPMPVGHPAKVALWLFDSYKHIPLCDEVIPVVDAVFCYEQTDIPQILAQFGITAFFLPQAVDPELYHPLVPEQEESSESREGFCDRRKDFGASGNEIYDRRKDFGASREEICDRRKDFGASREEICGSRKDSGASREEICGSRKHSSDFDIVFAGDLFHSAKRRQTICAVVEHYPELRIRVWGEYKPWYKNPWRWLTRERRDVYMNRNATGQQLNHDYNRSRMVLNIHIEQQKDGANPKVYEIAASGAYQICDANPYVERLFPHGEVGLYHNHEELFARIDEALAHDMSAQAEAARAIVCRDHTFVARIREVMLRLQNAPTIPSTK